MSHMISLIMQEESVQDQVILRDDEVLEKTYVLASYKGKNFPEESGRKSSRHETKAPKSDFHRSYIRQTPNPGFCCDSSF